MSILNYERAKKLSPYDEELNFNLKLANQKTEDKIDAAPQLFLSEWKNGIIAIFNEKYWSLLCILLFACSLLLLSLYIVSESNSLRKLGFWSGSVLFTVSILTFFIAQNKYELTKISSEAIVIAGTATIMGSPTEKGTKLFILHEGTKVLFTEEQNEWTEIKIANGNVGWIKTNLIEKI